MSYAEIIAKSCGEEEEEGEEEEGGGGEEEGRSSIHVSSHLCSFGYYLVLTQLVCLCHAVTLMYIQFYTFFIIYCSEDSEKVEGKFVCLYAQQIQAFIQNYAVLNKN